MLHLIWKSTLVLIAAGAVSLLLSRASAAMRHLVWMLALAGLLVLPLIERMPASWGARKLVYIPAMQIRVAAGATQRGTASRAAFPTMAFSIWLTGALVCLWRWNRGATKVARMRRNALPGNDLDIAAELGLRYNVPVLLSPREIVPLAAGIRHPYVLLPASAQQWSRDRLHVVLLHEMAHIRRRDSLTQALAELVRCLYWFHPLVWVAVHRLRAERERASDDLVLQAGTAASDYASHLLGLARSLKPSELLPVAVGMAATDLDTRIRAILNPRTNRRPLSRASGLFACLIAACVVLPLAAMRPQASPTGLVSGTVYDPAGARVPGAVVIASSSASELKSTTDQEGKFTIGPLTGGTWQLYIQAPGFAPRVLRADKDRFDITLDVGQIQENVVVHGKGTAATAAAPQRVRVGGNVTPAKLVYKINPEFPADAQSRGIQGDVVLRAVISAKGTVLSPAIISAPDPELAEAAMKAVREWRYQPSLLNGEPIETVTTITVNFALEP